MASTENADYVFTIKEGDTPASGNGDATAWVMCEPRTRELSIVGDNGFLGINLKPGTTLQEATEIVRFLKNHVVGLSYTKF